MKEFIVLSVFSVTTAIIINIVLFDSSFFKDDESRSITIENVFTDNMKDCQEKGGEYVLWITSAGEVQIEKCKIDREIYYYNK